MATGRRLETSRTSACRFNLYIDDDVERVQCDGTSLAPLGEADHCVVRPQGGGEARCDRLLPWRIPLDTSALRSAASVTAGPSSTRHRRALSNSGRERQPCGPRTTSDASCPLFGSRRKVSMPWTRVHTAFSISTRVGNSGSGTCPRTVDAGGPVRKRFRMRRKRRSQPARQISIARSVGFEDPLRTRLVVRRREEARYLR